MIRISVASAMIAFTALAMPAYAQRSLPDILYFESFELPELTTGNVQLSVFGRRFNVSLKRNDALLSRLPRSQRRAAAGIELWKGELEGLPDSWVRITRRGSFVSGAIWDGAYLYAIEPYSSAASRLLAPDVNPTSDLIIYQLDEPSASLRDLVLEDTSSPGPGFKFGSDNTSGSSLKPLSPVLEIEVGLIADADYDRFSEQNLGSDATTELLTIANILDGIFLLQVGVRIRVAELMIFTSEPDPFSVADPSALLTQLAQYKGNDSALAPLGLAHLVTGRELQESGPTQIIGIARTGSICDAYNSVSLTQGTFGSSRTALIAAHEIAHNLGAPHDNEAGSVCAAVPDGFLMAPNIGDNDHFSQCSIDQMHARIATATCVRPVPETDVSVTSMGTRINVLAGWPHSAGFLLQNDGTSDALGIEVVIETSPEMTIDDPEFPDENGLRCVQDLHTKTCSLDILPAGESIYAGVWQTAVTLGTATTTATVTLANDADLTNNTATYELEVLPAVKLSVVDFAPSTEVARPGQIVNVSVEMLNEGVVDATDVTLSLWLPKFFELESAALPGGGTCSPTLLGSICEFPLLPVGESQFADLQLHTRDLDIDIGQIISDELRVRLVAAERDANEGPWWTTRLSATPVLADVVLALDAPSGGTVGETAEFVFNIANQGPDTVPGMHFHFNNPGMAIDNWDGAGAACTITSDSASIDCDFAPVSANATRLLTVSGVTPRSGAFSVAYSLVADAYSLSPANNADNYGWRVSFPPANPPPTNPPPTNPPPPAPQPSSPPANGGGGGGSLDALTILFLLLSMARSQRLRLRLSVQ